MSAWEMIEPLGGAAVICTRAYLSERGSDVDGEYLLVLLPPDPADPDSADPQPIWCASIPRLVELIEAMRPTALHARVGRDEDSDALLERLSVRTLH